GGADLARQLHAPRDQLDDRAVHPLDLLAQARELRRLRAPRGRRVTHAAAAPSASAAGMVRPAASANGRNARISERKASTDSDWSPSDSASSGAGCTSMMRPSAPAAIAAKASGATRSARPPAWLGSTITGRCVSDLSTGIAAMSSVLRVAVSYVRVPRSQRMTSRLPCAITYSAAMGISFIVADHA